MMSATCFQMVQQTTVREKELFLQRARILIPCSKHIPIPVLHAPPGVPREQNALTEMDFKTPLHS